jgi:hypothetical protein
MESKIGAIVIKLRLRLSVVARRLRGKLRPVEWVLLLIGAAALLSFVYVLWRQPVSRR